MSDHSPILQVTRPGEVHQTVGRWIRLVRQRQELTQPMLASKSGVPVATLSRLEREGKGSLDSLARVLQALGELDRFHDHLQEQARKAALPTDLSERAKPGHLRQRVRLRRGQREGA